MTDWKFAVTCALGRYRARHSSNNVTRDSLVKEELGQIIKGTGTDGATPEQTLSRVLQEIRDDGDLKFKDDEGTYELVEDQLFKWRLEPGEEIKRVHLHDIFGGGRQGGISPSGMTRNVFIFTDESTGTQHGYFDRWEGQTFHYCGEGQTGDQKMSHGNKAIAEHHIQDRSLRVFAGVGGQAYQGEFELDRSEPFYRTQAPQTQGRTLSQVIMFRLVPVGTFQVAGEKYSSAGDLKPSLSGNYKPANENPDTAPRDPFDVDPNTVDRGLIAHAVTENALAKYAMTSGFNPINKPTLGDPNFDVGWWDGDTFVVVEVKSLTDSNEASQLRLGLGQIIDYADVIQRSGRKVRPVLAVERAPTQQRWMKICIDHGVVLVWPEILDTLTQ